MKLIIEAETEEEREALKQERIVFDDVKEYLIIGRVLKDGVLLAEIADNWHGSYEYLIGRLYVTLKKLEARMNGKQV